MTRPNGPGEGVSDLIDYWQADYSGVGIVDNDSVNCTIDLYLV